MTIFLVILHVVVSLVLMLVVLVQQGKGADLAGAFGGGGSQTAFGSRGATTILHKLTTWLFVAFIITSMALSIIQARPSGSVMSDSPAPAAAAPAPAPEAATPAPAAAEPAPAATQEQPAADDTQNAAPAAPETPAQ